MSYYSTVTSDPGREKSVIGAVKEVAEGPDSLWDQIDAQKGMPDRYRNTMEALYGGGDYDRGQGGGGWQDPTTGQVVPTHMGGFAMPGPKYGGQSDIVPFSTDQDDRDALMEQAEARAGAQQRGFGAAQSMNAPGLGQTQYGTAFTQQNRGVGSLRYADLLRR